jgi:alkylated DNA repair dioxygenase AlkB
MTVAKNPQEPLRLKVDDANYHLTPEQFERLSLDNPNLQLEDGQLVLMIPSIQIEQDTPENTDRDLQNLSEEDPETVHTLDRQGEPFTYSTKDLYWNPKAHDYIKEQKHSFRHHLPELVETFGGKYIVFENGQVIDSDRDEEILLDRIEDTDFYKNRPDAILCTFVPRSLEVNAEF